MITRRREAFGGHACIRLENNALSLWTTTSVGPRILGLALHGEENLFAVLPEETLDCPGEGVFHFYGGHRLWQAPEDPPHTYLPDDLPVDVQEIDEGLCLTQPVQATTQVQKQIFIRMPDQGAQVTVEHMLYNRGNRPIELAPWAITQLRTGGMAILPLSAPAVDGFKVLPNRSLALWPYTDLSSSHIQWGKAQLRISAIMEAGQFKIGIANPAGWLAYLIGDTLFVKYVPYQAEEEYYDLGCSSECYCDPRFMELESLGPRTVLEPGESARHEEKWELVSGVSLPEDEAELIGALRQLGLSLPGWSL